jgi:hypothetical protein
MKPTHNILTDYIDHQLIPEEKASVENMLKQDKDMAADLEYLKLAVETVRLDTIQSKVSAIRNAQTTGRVVNIEEKSGRTEVRNMFGKSLRIAAVFITLMGLTILYKYISVSNESVYDKQFTGYELNNSRSTGNQDLIAEAYQNRDWNKVISLYQSRNPESNKASFIAGISEMQLKKFPEAITIFENILKSPDAAFHEESEYYLALASLMNHDEIKAVQLLKKIKANPSHTYYPVANNISEINLKIIELKK